MFYLIAIVSFLFTFIGFSFWGEHNFALEYSLFFFSSLFTTIISGQLAGLKTKVEEQEERIKKLEELRKNDFD